MNETATLSPVLLPDEQTYTEPDLDLIEFISWKESEPATARSAWSALYLRHAPFLARRCQRMGNDAEDVVQETFQKVFHNASTFAAPPELNRQDPVEVRRYVRAWLCQIAQNCFNDLCRSNLSQLRVYDPSLLDRRQANVPKKDDSPQSKQLQIFLEILASDFKDRELDILITSYQYWDFANDCPELPPQVIEKICNQYHIKSPTIRQIRKRAIDRLRERGVL